MNKEQKIAEIREKHSTGHYNYNYEIRDAIQFLLDELERVNRERNKLIEGLRWYADKTNYVQEVHHLRHGTLIGPAEAIYYDEGQRARDILREVGVTVE